MRWCVSRGWMCIVITHTTTYWGPYVMASCTCKTEVTQFIFRGILEPFACMDTMLGEVPKMPGCQQSMGRHLLVLVYI